MNASAHDDELFRAAVSAIDEGDIATLDRMLRDHPRLAHIRLEQPGSWLRDMIGQAADGFFAQPYLLWFVAEDPVRNGKLPSNIAEVARTIIAAARREAPDTLQEQLDYALTLVSWSWIADQNNVQIPLIDVLADEGAQLDAGPSNALVNGHLRAAAHLVDRGAQLALGTALCLDRFEEATPLFEKANDAQKSFALVLCALNKKADAVRWLIQHGVDANRRSEDLYSHAMPLHHAVSSGDLDTVKAMLEGNPYLNPRDSAWAGTPMGWADYYVRSGDDPERLKQFKTIRDYLKSKGAVE